jgi:hypothetical protein
MSPSPELAVHIELNTLLGALHVVYIWWVGSLNGGLHYSSLGQRRCLLGKIMQDVTSCPCVVCRIFLNARVCEVQSNGWS